MRQQRFTITEYGPPNHILSDIAARTARPLSDIRSVVAERGERIAATLGLKDSPLSHSGSALSAEGIAGLVRVARGIELEIAPKFLGSGEAQSGWREDFFFLAMLSRHGYLLTREGISSARGTSDLLTLLAGALINLYWQLHRRPLKAYRHLHEQSFFLDGEVDPFDLKSPGPDGYEQVVFQFTRSNEVNSIIKLAALTLASQVRNHALQERLLRLGSHLGSQPDPPRREIATWRLPPRARAWQPLLDLAVDIIAGVGVGFQSGERSAPGFVVNTWRVWQDLLTIATQNYFGAAHALAEKRRVFGSRSRPDFGDTTDLVVKPDLRIENGRTPAFLVDAKYKGRVGRTGFRISAADLYESLAFSQAWDNCRVLLAYPRSSDKKLMQLGSIAILEEVRIGATRVVAFDVEVRGISTKKGGLANFTEGYGSDLEEMTLSL